MEDFDELDLQKLIESALAQNPNQHPFGGSETYLGLAETDILSTIYSRLENKLTISEITQLFHNIRVDILSRKISTNIRDLHTVTKNCRRCNIDSVPELPKWNVENPDVAIVIDSPSISSEAVTLMINAFKDSGFSSNQLCLTYVNRCPLKRKYDEQEIINCSPYLHLELQLLNPKLILCLGATPASILFGSPIKIKELRGKINWLGYWPILVTYSPMYILKSGGTTPEHFSIDIKQAYDFIHKR